MKTHPFNAVWFDLDGTLLDTATDITEAINQSLKENGYQQVKAQDVRARINYGVLGIFRYLFKLPDTAEIDNKLIETFNRIYRQQLSQTTTWFPHMDSITKRLEKEGTPWGIITNKHRQFAEPLTVELNIRHRLAALVCGDTLSKAKPHPEPLWHACQLAGVTAKDGLYVGDSGNDMLAGKAAGMRTAAACYGYITNQEDIQHWQADYLLNTPEDLIRLLWGENT